MLRQERTRVVAAVLPESDETKKQGARRVAGGMISWISDVPILGGWPDHWRRHNQLLLALAVMAVLAVALIALELSASSPSTLT